MRSPASSLTVAAVLALVGASAQPALASDTVVRSVEARAQVASRTSLTVSSELLHFTVTDPAAPAIAVVEFAAGARTHGGAEVVLTVESVRGLEGPGGAANMDASIVVSGEGEGTAGGAMSSSPVVAGRWMGSGRRAGRLSFALRVSAVGTYTLPVRFILSAP